MKRIKRNIWVLILMCTPSAAFAYTAGGDMFDSILKGLLDFLTSTPARIIAIIAIIGVGYATLSMGKMPKDKAICTVVGIGLVFGASYIAQTYFGIGS